ncbi:MAG: hypothetical protein GY722_26305 [bacterium]|nr:hypothetical protein [bacterium]
MPDPESTVTRIDFRTDGASSGRVCRSSALPGPVTGRDEYTIVDGKIVRLEVRIAGD